MFLLKKQQQLIVIVALDYTHPFIDMTASETALHVHKMNNVTRQDIRQHRTVDMM